MTKAHKRSRHPHPSDPANHSASCPAKPTSSCHDGCPEIKLIKHPYRVFISYSHKDQALAIALQKHLALQGLFPITDHEIRVGEAFSEEIRDMIECAHVFMPLVTANANERLWVQQEIGYAAALHVPVCPVAVGNLPSGMAEHIQGIHIADVDGKSPAPDLVMSVVIRRLNYEMIDDLVRRARWRLRQGRYDCAMSWMDRQELLVKLTDAAYRGGCKLVRDHKEPEQLDRRVWRVRQCTAFGSFSIPDAGINSPKWDQRDPDRYRSQHERRLLRRERQAMEAYANCFGCDMILDPRVSLRSAADGVAPAPGRSAGDERSNLKHSPEGTALRTRLLIEFIEAHKDDDRVRVIIPKEKNQITTNLVIVGDWFASEAVVPHSGSYERTMFTRHAPSVLNMIGRFDQDFEDFLRDWDLDPKHPDTATQAKAAALDVLRQWLAHLESEMATPSAPPPIAARARRAGKVTPAHLEPLPTASVQERRG